MTVLRYLGPLLLAACGGNALAPPDGGGSDGSTASSDGGVAATALALGGCYSAHTVPVTMGGTQTFQLNVDTGSASLGVAEVVCQSCATAGVTPLYAPGGGATDLMKPVSSKFDTGELGWSGEAYRDVATIGGLAAPVDFAAITDQTQYFFDGSCDTATGAVAAPYQGIIGFGPKGLLVPGTTSWIGALAEQQDAVPDVFALSLCHVGGRMWIGGYDESAVAAPVQWVPMTQQAGYLVGWRGVGVGAQTVAFPAGTAGFTDSGGPGMIVPDASYAKVASALQADARFAAVLGATFLSSTATGFSNCVTLADSPAALDEKLPTLDLQLGPDGEPPVKLTATHSYLTYSYAGANQVMYCQGLTAGGTAYGDFFYIGQSVMLDRVVVHDRAGGRMGFAPVKVSCAD